MFRKHADRRNTRDTAPSRIDPSEGLCRTGKVMLKGFLRNRLDKLHLRDQVRELPTKPVVTPKPDPYADCRCDRCVYYPETLD